MTSLAERSSAYRQMQPPALGESEEPSVAERYSSALQDYLLFGEPGALSRARELGRCVLREAGSIAELMNMHKIAFALYCEDRPMIRQSDQQQDTQAALRFLESALAPFEESRTGQQDAINALRQRLDRQDRQTREVARSLNEQTVQQLDRIDAELNAFSRNAPPRVAARLHQLLRMLGATREQVQTLSHELRPLILDQLGLIPALRFMALGIRNQSGLDVTVHGETAGRIPEPVCTVLHRVVQEALTNVVQHAEAVSAEVRIWIYKEVVYCVISDDGKGFEVSVEGGQARRGLGLLGIDERVDSVGGTCKVISRPGEGAQLQVAIPL